MSKYNFDKVVNRENTNCIKWDFRTRCSQKATQDGLPLWVADMDFECAEPIVNSLRKRIEHKIFGYTSEDTKEYKYSVCGWYKKRFNLEVDGNNIFFSPGVVPAIITLVKILTEENDTVIIQHPVYTPFELKDKLDIGSPSPFAVVSAMSAYNECEDWLNELNQYIDENIEFIDKYLKENLPKAKLVKPQGTYLAWVDFNEYGLSEIELEDIMFKKAKVLFNQGYNFGKEGKGFVRINAACPRSILKECMDRIKNAF